MISTGWVKIVPGLEARIDQDVLGPWETFDRKTFTVAGIRRMRLRLTGVNWKTLQAVKGVTLRVYFTTINSYYSGEGERTYGEAVVVEWEGADAENLLPKLEPSRLISADGGEGECDH